MLISAIKKQTSDCLFYFIKSLYGISQTWKSGITKKKKVAAILRNITDFLIFFKKCIGIKAC